VFNLRSGLWQKLQGWRLSTRVLLFFIVATLLPLYAMLALSLSANSEILRQQQLEHLTPGRRLGGPDHRPDRHLEQGLTPAGQ
jgi:hypothetical protein